MAATITSECKNGNEVFISETNSSVDQDSEQSMEPASLVVSATTSSPATMSETTTLTSETTNTMSETSNTTSETSNTTSETTSDTTTTVTSKTTSDATTTAATVATNITFAPKSLSTTSTSKTPSLKSTASVNGGRVPGDLVWARMKGFSWWPSRITEPNPDIKPPAAARHKKHYFCYFFGSDNFAWVEEEKMAVYDGNREKLKPAKISANLQAAIDKIEEALVEWKLRRGSDIYASTNFDEDASSSSSLPTQRLFDFDDEDSDEDADIFSSNIMSNRNGNVAHSPGLSPRLAWRGEDSSGGSDGESSLGFSAVKRKAPSVGQSNANNNNDTSKDAIDSPVKTKRARKAPSKLADYAVGGDIRDPSATTASVKTSASPSKPRDASAPTPKTQHRGRKAAAAASAAAASAAALAASDSTSADSTTSILSVTSSASPKSTSKSKAQDPSSKAAPKSVNHLDCAMPSSSSTSSSASPAKLRMSPSALRFGFIGLGAMGSALASSLLKSGHRVTVWNRTSAKCKELVKDGASKAASAAEVVSASDVTFSCVSDPSALKEVVFGNCGALQGIAEGKGYVDMSTVDVETCLEVAEAVTSRGGRFLEAPLCGSKQAAKRGCLTVLASGDKSLYDDCQSCFNAISKKAFYFGDVGNASKMKNVMNLLDGVMMAGLAEALALTEQVGLRHQDVMEVLELGSLDCDLVRDKGREMMEGTFTPSVALKHQQKDLKLAVNMADEHHLPLVTTAAANELFKRARAMGYDEHDNSAVYRAAQYNS